MQHLAPFDIAWIEEPTSPDDVLGHAAIARGVAPIRVATGEHGANRVMFKQFLQADALQVLQIDATRVAGVNENIAIMLLAHKFGVPVCPHAGGVGLCELVQHLSMFDFVALSGTRDDRVIEFVDHLHEHFVTPVVVHARTLLAADRGGLRRRDARVQSRRVRIPGSGLSAATDSRVGAQSEVGLKPRSHCSTPEMCTVLRASTSSASPAARASTIAACSERVRLIEFSWVRPRQTLGREPCGSTERLDQRGEVAVAGEVGDRAVELEVVRDQSLDRRGLVDRVDLGAERGDVELGDAGGGEARRRRARGSS